MDCLCSTGFLRAMAMAQSHKTVTQVQAGLRIDPITGKFTLVQSPISNRKGRFMPAKKSTGLAVLLQIESDRAVLARREKEVRETAAIEVGEAVLDVVGSSFSLTEISSLMKAVRDRGYTATMAALGCGAVLKPRAGNGAAAGASHDAA